MHSVFPVFVLLINAAAAAVVLEQQRSEMLSLKVRSHRMWCVAVRHRAACCVVFVVYRNERTASV